MACINDDVKLHADRVWAIEEVNAMIESILRHDYDIVSTKMSFSCKMTRGVPVIKSSS